MGYTQEWRTEEVTDWVKDKQDYTWASPLIITRVILFRFMLQKLRTRASIELYTTFINFAFVQLVITFSNVFKESKLC